MENQLKTDRHLLSFRLIDILKIALFGLVILIFCVLGFIWFLRPEVSMVEKRELTKFPEFTLEGLWDGSYCKNIGLWYSDTFPFRDNLISVKLALEDFYGKRSEQIIYTKTAPAESEEKSEVSPKEKPKEPVPDGIVHNFGESIQGVYIVDNRGFELYTFLEDINLKFIESMNNIYGRISPNVNMYVMIVPTNSGVMFGNDLIEKLGVSNQVEAVDYINARLDPGIKKIDAIRELRKHNQEYVYFYTDHHWTGLGAYYAYLAFCETKGIEPHDINEYEKVSYPGFLGSLYSFSRKSPALAANPDTVEAYIPKSTNDMIFFAEDGSKREVKIINDLTGGRSSALYSTFVYGDQPFSYAHNPTLTDGSGVLVIKDSLGNAFIPWLVDHYEHIFWVDARYFESNISELLEHYQIQDVIYEVGIYNASKPAMFECYENIGK